MVQENLIEVVSSTFGEKQEFREPELRERTLGRVVSVTGSQVVMLVGGDLQAASARSGNGIQMGQLVKMRLANQVVFGLVTGLSIPLPRPDDTSSELRIVEMELLGEIVAGTNASFQRGVSALPELGENVYSTTQDDLRQVYSLPNVSTVRIGTIHQDRALPVCIATDDLLGKHFAILGTTGSGKSCAMALILHAILDQHPGGHVVLLDPHDEYSHAFGDNAEKLSPSNLKLPYWLFSFKEIVEVIFGSDARNYNTEIAILNEFIPAAKRRYSGQQNDEKLIGVDTPVPYQMTDLLQILDEAMGRLDNPDKSIPYVRLKNRLNGLRLDSRFAFMFGGLTVRDNMSAILSRIFRIPVEGRPITIMDLSGVPSEILNVVVSVLCRMTFDFALWSDRAVPIMLVCEEAHRYAPQDSSLGFEPTKNALARIAKEGRKYGVSLCIVSQRPAELATEILSQCNTVFALRMTNQNDQDFVRAALWDSAAGLLDSLPSLRNTEAIAWGEGISVPVRLCFDHLPEERRPLSGTASFSSAWKTDLQDSGFLDLVVDRWRYQRRR